MSIDWMVWHTAVSYTHLDTEIPHSVRAAECSLTGESIFAHDKTGKVAAAYENLTKEAEQLERAAQTLSLIHI